MDPFNKPPKPNTSEPIQRYLEPEYALNDLKVGRFHVARLSGQIHLYIPRTLVDSIGKEEIKQLAEHIYTKDILEKFYWTQADYRHSLMFELPPKKDKQDQKVEQLMAAIESYK